MNLRFPKIPTVFFAPLKIDFYAKNRL